MAMLVFDIETGPLPEEQLRLVYKEPRFEEFCETCDQRWNAAETRQQAIEYLTNDLDMTWRLAERMGVIL